MSKPWLPFLELLAVTHRTLRREKACLRVLALFLRKQRGHFRLAANIPGKETLTLVRIKLDAIQRKLSFTV